MRQRAQQFGRGGPVGRNRLSRNDEDDAGDRTEEEEGFRAPWAMTGMTRLRAPMTTPAAKSGPKTASIRVGRAEIRSATGQGGGGWFLSQLLNRGWHCP